MIHQSMQFLTTVDPDVGNAIQAEFRRQQQNIELIASENIVSSAVLAAAGSDITKVVKTTCFLADMADFAAFNEVYAKHFVSKPARSCCAVKTLPKNVLCEIEAIAEL